jgi:hypothetical protein
MSNDELSTIMQEISQKITLPVLASTQQLLLVLAHIFM